jgi:threonine dehydrogenase-like Zn-dependent dehydrogenase
VDRAAPAAGETAMVIGAGTLGLLAVQLLHGRGCRVLAVSRSSRRLGLASDLGADATVALDAGDAREGARRLSGRDGADLVIETAGTASAVELVLGQAGLVRPGGRVVLTGLPHEPARIDVFQLVRRELDVRGSMIYQGEFAEALALLARGAVDVSPLLTHRFPLGRLEEALETHRRPEAIKVAVFPSMR